MHRATFLATLMGDGGPSATSIRALPRYERSFTTPVVTDPRRSSGGGVVTVQSSYLPHVQDLVLLTAAFTLSSSLLPERRHSGSRARTCTRINELPSTTDTLPVPYMDAEEPRQPSGSPQQRGRRRGPAAAVGLPHEGEKTCTGENCNTHVAHAEG